MQFLTLMEFPQEYVCIRNTSTGEAMMKLKRLETIRRLWDLHLLDLVLTVITCRNLKPILPLES